MNKRTILGIWNANLPQWIWACLPFWIASIIFALDGKAPEWGTLVLFMITAVMLQATVEFANTIKEMKKDIAMKSNAEDHPSDPK